MTQMISIIQKNSAHIVKDVPTTIYETETILEILGRDKDIEYFLINCSNLYDSTESKRKEIRHHNQTQNKSVVARYTSQEKNRDCIWIHTTVNESITEKTRIVLQLNSMLAHVVQNEKWKLDGEYRKNIKTLHENVRTDIITTEFYLNYLLVQARSKDRYLQMGFVTSLSEQITNTLNDDDQEPIIDYPHYSVVKKLPLALSSKEREYLIFHNLLYNTIQADLRVITSEITGYRTSVQSIWVRIDDEHAINVYVKCGIKLIDTGIENVIIPKVNMNVGRVWVQADPNGNEFSKIEDQDEGELYDMFRRNIEKQKHNHLGTIVLSEGEFLYMKLHNKERKYPNMVITIDGVNWISIITKDIKLLNDSWAYVPFKYIDNLSSLSYVMLSNREIYVPLQEHKYPPISNEEDEANRRNIKKILGSETRFRRGKDGVDDRTDYGKNKKEMGNSVPCVIQYSEEHLGIMPIHHEPPDNKVLLDSEIVGIISQLETALRKLASSSQDPNKRRNPESPQPSRPYKHIRVEPATSSMDALTSFANMSLL